MTAVGEIPQVALVVSGELLVFRELPDPIFLKAMFQRRPGELASYQRHDSAVAVRAANKLFISVDAIWKRRIDAEPFGKGRGRLRPPLVFGDDRHGDLMRRHPPIDVHRIAQAQLLAFVHSLDRNGNEVNVMRVESSLETDLVGPLSEGFAKVLPVRGPSRILQVLIKLAHLEE